MTDDKADMLIASIHVLTRNVQRLVYAIGAASNKTLLNDGEFASLLGHAKPEVCQEWIQTLKKNGHIKSTRAGKLRRWRRSEAEQFVNMLQRPTEERPIVVRKPRLKRPA